MDIKELFSKTVIDKNANEIGKIQNAEFDVETGTLETISIETRKNIGCVRFDTDFLIFNV